MKEKSAKVLRDTDKVLLSITSVLLDAEAVAAHEYLMEEFDRRWAETAPFRGARDILYRWVGTYTRPLLEFVGLTEPIENPKEAEDNGDLCECAVGLCEPEDCFAVLLWNGDNYTVYYSRPQSDHRNQHWREPSIEDDIWDDGDLED